MTHGLIDLQAIRPALAAGDLRLANNNHRLLGALTEMPRLDLVLRVTALMLVLYGSTGWVAKVVLSAAGGVMLLHPDFIRSSRLWLLLLAAVTFSNVSSWYTIDNHKYLMMYWTLACALTLGATNPQSVLALNGRLLIGLCFAFALGWKILGGQYLDGSFLHGTFLLDPRLQTATAMVGGITEAEVGMNRRLMALLVGSGVDGATVPLLTNATIRRVTLISSYWTLLIEGLVAASFLAAVMPHRSPSGDGINALVRHIASVMRFRDAYLILFIVTTYFLLPVVPFAMLLCILGLAQADDSSSWTVRGYLVALLIVQLSMIPWTRYVFLTGLV